jgi:hypothetical protein
MKRPVPKIHAHRISPESDELGALIAQACEARDAVMRERAGDAPNRCSTCAGREGTLPNRCADTLIQLLSCTKEGEPFYCHHGVKLGGEPKVACGAYLLLRDDA